ncbi:hypothetical protein E0E50_12010 [Azotobacter chroococcum subsp. isscasi]|nr:hypothetical protein E0E50_12010 [Azotobacter chroococcum subsp. isscasi]
MDISIERGCVARYLLGLLAVGLTWMPELGMAMDVYDVYQKSLEKESKYQEAIQTYLSKREAKDQGFAGLLPRVELRGSYEKVYQKKKVDSQTSESSADYYQEHYEVKLLQPLFDAEKMALFRKGKREALQAEIELELARQELRLRVVEAFFEALYAQDSLRAYEAQKKATFEFMDQAKKSFDIGTVTANDVYDAESRYELVSVKVMQAEIDLELKRKALEVLTGDPVDFIQPLRSTIKLLPPQPATLKTWLDQAATSNLEVQIQNFSTEIASAELDYNRAGHYPRLEFTASANLDDQSGTMSSFEETGPGQRTNDSYVGLMLTVPIFEGGYVQSKVREAKHAQAASHQKLDDIRKESIEKAREGFINTVVGAKKIETLYSAVTSSQESLRASKLGYGVGVRTAVDVLNAQEQLSSSLRERAKTIYDSIIFSLKLKASVGTLSDEDIMQLRAYTDYSNAPVNNTGF